MIHCLHKSQNNVGKQFPTLFCFLLGGTLEKVRLYENVIKIRIVICVHGTFSYKMLILTFLDIWFRYIISIPTKGSFERTLFDPIPSLLASTKVGVTAAFLASLKNESCIVLQRSVHLFICSYVELFICCIATAFVVFSLINNSEVENGLRYFKGPYTKLIMLYTFCP